MSVEGKRRGRGLPRDLAKLEAILDAAYDLFLDRGIAATPMDLVARRNGLWKDALTAGTAAA
jgi:TetR/AcrR family transcriptional regulator, mexJK operon transcriptional repressor